jgi:hypothetical protein
MVEAATTPNRFTGERIQGLLFTINLVYERHCADHKCVRVIKVRDNCWMDEDGRIFCEQCGKCLKFHRRRAAERGETYREEF